MEDLSKSEMPALAARLFWHKGLMEKCTATRHIQSMKWRIPYSLLVSHSGLFQNTCQFFRCMRYFILSQRGFHPTLSVFVTITWCQSYFPYSEEGLSAHSQRGEGTESPSLQTSRPFLFLVFVQVTCLDSGQQLLPLCGGGSNPESPSFSLLLSPSLVSFRP